MLQTQLNPTILEAGCDEAGRGCLAGPVFASAVILAPDYKNHQLNDSKKLSEKQRYKLREVIEKDALYFAIAKADAQEIDEINILNASILAMHRAVKLLPVTPDFLLIDGNRFKPYENIPHQTIIKGDGLYMNIAAASILAKTERDAFMLNLHREFPQYGWQTNMGYPTATHIAALQSYGPSPWHRNSFKLKPKQLHLSI